MVDREQTRTPNPAPDDYDWRKEPWVNDSKVRALAHYIAFHVITAIAAQGKDDGDKRDAVVFALLNPAMTESVWKGPEADEIVDHRLACAAAQGIDELITRWMKMCGSIDSPGMPTRSRGPTQ